MPSLNFQARFAPLVESGEKRQTIRAYRKDGRDPKRGDKLYLFTGMRTKACRPLIVERTAASLRRMAARFGLFGHAVECKRVERVRLYALSALSEPVVEIFDLDGNLRWAPDFFSDPFQAERRFAQRDGFRNWREMVAFFETTHGLPFTGLLTRW